ncbi:MAG: glycosyltransferase family 2 protein [Desulfobacteraceae bacterium]|nr:MAG: glycosyltransferase family 2 protein [Desulfobacteraceae bacterium]
MNEYVLLTAARNEEDFIEKPLRAVVSQTVKPKRWIIVNDGSVDRTAEIVRRFAAKEPFIELIDTSGDSNRNFGSKARAINFAYERTGNIDFDFVGNLDADVSFDPTYYEEVLSRFAENPRLGIAGGIRYDRVEGRYIRVKSAQNSVGGPFQMFRRECFEKIGGYLPLQYGGIDAVAEISARMHGWQVRCFPELRIFHYRMTGSATSGRVGVKFKAGIKEYLIGYHPVFQMLRAASSLTAKPAVFGSMAWICGYYWAFLKRFKRPVSNDFVRYLRSEQLRRIRSALPGLETRFTAGNRVSPISQTSMRQ